ncbi:MULTISPECIES: hypothetical protein [Serratia]|uniref:Uncharacterized protein n=1 Tax=Serratia quinivorans TaxID=137545 RepID=A0A379YDP2_9GAMM|nr:MULTISPECIES: hypothetical protein [Serratia]RYM55460.1 hypothetical protein BSR03_27060 [Serratia proteamaculans]CAI1831249.1 Uncharacterised protein [Serratia quinivorans]SUI44036.1 Uncharacterised protein [Serratia quinivorans]
MAEKILWTGNSDTVPENVYHNVSAYAGNSVSGFIDEQQIVTWDFNFLMGSTNGPYTEGIVIDGERYFWQEGNTYKIVTTLTDPIEVTTERFTVFSWRGESFNVDVFEEGLFYLEHEHGGASYYVLSHVMDPPIPAFIDIVPGSTNAFQMTVHLSSNKTLGWLEIVLNGEPVIFGNGSSRIYLKTYDGLKTNPVWSCGKTFGDSANVYMSNLQVYLVME